MDPQGSTAVLGSVFGTPYRQNSEVVGGAIPVLAEHRFCEPKAAPSSGQRGYQNPIRLHTKWIYNPFGISIVADFAEKAPNANTLRCSENPRSGAGTSIL